MGEIISFLTAGAFVYLGLKIKLAFGDPLYYVLVAFCLLTGFALGRIKGF